MTGRLCKVFYVIALLFASLLVPNTILLEQTHHFGSRVRFEIISYSQTYWDPKSSAD